MIQIDMELPKCCDECFALDDHGYYLFCLISQDQRGYMFNVRENRMPSCPLKAQEPRLLTVDDFKNNSDVDICGYLPCWVEPNPYNDAATEKPGWGLVSVGQIGGVYHRYWISKPSLKQMEETPWE